jgi:hypothetical protein
MFGLRKLFRGIAQLVERRPLESDVGGSNPSTPAIIPAPETMDVHMSIDLWNGNGQLKLDNISSVRIKCIECKKMSGIITILCWDERNIERIATAYRVACPKCNTIFKFVLNPVRCLACDDPNCDELPGVNFWET